MSVDFQRLVDRHPAPRHTTTTALTSFTGVIVKVTDEGAFCSPVTTDLGTITVDNPLGPCRGYRYRDTSNCAGTAHAHPLVPYPAGTVVCVQATAGGYWIVRAEGY